MNPYLFMAIVCYIVLAVWIYYTKCGTVDTAGYFKCISIFLCLSAVLLLNDISMVFSYILLLLSIYLPDSLQGIPIFLIAVLYTIASSYANFAA